MKLEPPKNENYAAIVCRLPPLQELEGLDNLVAASLFGFQALVSRNHQEGDWGIAFTAETQLSDDFCRENNLYRHAEKNKDSGETGYLEDTRRIKAIKLRGHRSDCLFMPMESVEYTGIDVDKLSIGDFFDALNGQEICRKYVIQRQPGHGHQQKKQEKKFNRVDPVLFPEHVDTHQYLRESHLIPQDAHVYVTQKIHGTSVRLGRTLVKRQLSFRERVAQRLGVKVQTNEWDAIAGSRKVIKDPNNQDQNHFYREDGDIWTAYLRKVDDLIPEGFIIYGELVGWTPSGAPIQTGYTYCQPNQTHQLYVYRVATINVRGLTVDLSWPLVKQFCRERGLLTVPDLWEGGHSEFNPEDWLDKRFHDEGYLNALPLGDDKKLVDEGVCIRWDGLKPLTLKAKSPIFLQAESKMLDKGEADIESIESEEIEEAA